jgi:NitT/TauT family transport system ATP-binding protein
MESPASRPRRKFQPERTLQCYGPRPPLTTGRVTGWGGRVRSLVVPPRIELRDVSKSFGTLDALAPVSFDVAEGETVTLLGPSGCGKTTLLRLIAGLETPTSGEIVVNGMTPGEARRHKQIGFVPQAPALLPWRTVEANARLLLDINRSASPATPSVSVTDLLDEVGLGEFLDAYPHELSGGMQQRVGLVRAFALDAPILLMDEPFAALDEMTRTDMRHLLGRLREPLGTTVVFVTHSIPEATFLSDRVAVMSARPGRVTDDITIDLAHPRTPDIEDTDEFFHVTTRLRSALSAGRSR